MDELKNGRAETEEFCDYQLTVVPQMQCVQCKRMFEDGETQTAPMEQCPKGGGGNHALVHPDNIATTVEA